MTRLQQGQSQNHIAMRELHLKISPTSDADEIAWRKVLFLAAGRFKNLNRVYILLEHITSQERFGCKTPQQWETNLPGYQNRAMEAILGLKRLPIVHVTFTIDDHIMERTTNAYERSPFSRWTLEEKREWARYVKGKLLHDYP